VPISLDHVKKPGQARFGGWTVCLRHDVRDAAFLPDELFLEGTKINLLLAPVSCIAIRYAGAGFIGDGHPQHPAVARR